ncbi:hypothetical protein BU25DRAFT_406976 [Macroventuria anomochaeta]|uniref:Uncharacterized protein n=1 Tax=Macroventuria anomochaeta TaxID=301207 RepID=A0ACB6SEI4_9PLEO|nr:uncharacterized protein BU25DRAFT_406976 [Macroventuria anomochaeta]KAF2632449.1 hypothetical protein BU25DRAFT_406976 [Macroventuria anomochaeta]
MDYFGRNSMSGSAVDEDVDATPLAASRYPSSLSEAKSRSDVEAENRLSFPSLYSIGSALYANTRRHSRSGRSSVVGSEADGAYSH